MVIMDKKIAVVLDHNGKTTSIYEPSIIKVYEKEKEAWKVIKEFAFNINNLKGIKYVRESITSMIEALDNCKIIVAQEIAGVSYNILDMAEFKIWEIEGVPEDFLDYILEKLEQDELSMNSAAAESKVITIPVPTDKEGCYYINLKELQQNKSGVTSKQALLPFLRNSIFYELQVICSHIPPWLEGQLKSLNMKANTSKIDTNEYKITIYPKTCNE